MPEQKTDYTILIAEDNCINRIVLTNMLKHLNKRIVEVENGREALDALGELKDTATVLLLDLNMPVLDGYGVIRKMAENAETYRNVKTMVVSGTFYNDFLEKGLGEHINAYLEKPVVKEQLIHKLRECVINF